MSEISGRNASIARQIPRRSLIKAGATLLMGCALVPTARALSSRGERISSPRDDNGPILPVSLGSFGAIWASGIEAQMAICAAIQSAVQQHIRDEKCDGGQGAVMYDLFRSLGSLPWYMPPYQGAKWIISPETLSPVAASVAPPTRFMLEGKEHTWPGQVVLGDLEFDTQFAVRASAWEEVPLATGIDFYAAILISTLEEQDRYFAGRLISHGFTDTTDHHNIGHGGMYHWQDADLDSGQPFVVSPALVPEVQVFLQEAGVRNARVVGLSNIPPQVGILLRYEPVIRSVKSLVVMPYNEDGNWGFKLCITSNYLWNPGDLGNQVVTLPLHEMAARRAMRPLA